MKFYKYQGAGNDFLIADNRDGHFSERDGVLYARSSSGREWSRSIADLCDRRYGVGADGLMLLEEGRGCDFTMTYFNSDGSGGMMCGNGGRCIVAFAADMGLTSFDFEAADGRHSAQIIGSGSGKSKIVRLRMKDVESVSRYESLSGVSVPSDGMFLDTGTRHFVRLVSDVCGYDVVGEGREIRYGADEFLPVGVNVNFMEPVGDWLWVRTYEKGVEDETFACGTGIVASCIAAFLLGLAPAAVDADGARVCCKVRAKRDELAVDFIPSATSSGQSVAEDVWLTGPAVFVAEISIE